MGNQNSAVKRLYEILQDTEKVKRKLSRHSKSKSKLIRPLSASLFPDRDETRSVLSEAFGPKMPYAHVVFGMAIDCDYNDYRTVLQYTELLINLVDQALEEVNSITRIEETEKYKRPLIKFRDTVNNGVIRQPWDEFGEFINNRVEMEMLSVCADIVAMENPQLNDISKKDLDDLLKETEELLQSVNSADIDDDIKVFLNTRLEEITIAIRRYNIGGSAHLQKVIESNIGAILLKSASLKTHKKRNVELIKAAFKLILTIGGVLDFGANVEGYLLPKSADVIERILPAVKD